jgi:hypothetical protein
MARVLIQAGHSAAFPPQLAGGGGAPGEAAWVSDLAQRIAALLRPRGIDVTLVGTWAVFVGGNLVVRTPPNEVHQDYDLFLALHYDAFLPQQGIVTGCLAGRAALDPAGARADAFIAHWTTTYPGRLGIPLHQERLNPNITDYYGFRATTKKTPGVLLEHGVVVGDDHATLFAQIDKVAEADAQAVCHFLGLSWSGQPSHQPTIDQVGVLREALRLANWQKHEMEAYIVDDAHQKSVDAAAVAEGNPPIVLMLRWARDHYTAGETAP